MEPMCIIKLTEGVSNPLLKGWAYITIAEASLRGPRSSPCFHTDPGSVAQSHQINLSQTCLSSPVQGPAYQVKFKSQPAWLLKFSFKRAKAPHPILSQLEHSSPPQDLITHHWHPFSKSSSFLQGLAPGPPIPGNLQGCKIERLREILRQKDC